jgi:cytidine deaminase
MIDDNELIRRAKEVVIPRWLSDFVEVGVVGSALVTDKGNIYTGISISAACSVGFCAEHNAIGNMVTNGESKITSIVAVDCDGKILAPCGRCREFISQMDKGNGDTRVILSNKVMTLRDLLPESLGSSS